ncbi:MAG: hypothetical protein ACI8W7_003471 [Gammaproteobacteria bacterium]|jgi:hypothetical protein
MVVQLGLPPRRIDLLTQITAVSFAHAWPRREIRTVGDIDVLFLDRDSLLVNKRQTGRAHHQGQDLQQVLRCPTARCRG